MFVRNRSAIMTFLTSKPNPLSQILLSPVKGLSHLNQERNMHRTSIANKRKQSQIVLNKYVGVFLCEKKGDGLFTGGSVIII